MAYLPEARNKATEEGSRAEAEEKTKVRESGCTVRQKEWGVKLKIWAFTVCENGKVLSIAELLQTQTA